MKINYYIEPNRKNQIKAGVTTLILFIIVMLLLFFVLGFWKKNPPDGEKGSMVQLGTFTPGEALTPPSEQIEKINQTNEKPVENVDKASEAAEKQLISNNADPESVALEQGKEKEQKPEKEEEKIEEQKKEKPEKEQEQINQNALFPVKNTNTASQGTTEGNGQEGIQTGNPESSNTGTKSTGQSNVGQGHGLNGRWIISGPGKVQSKCKESGIIEIMITVNSKGNVIGAKFWKGENADQCLVNEALEIAKKYQFSEDRNRIEQSGILPIKFMK